MGQGSPTLLVLIAVASFGLAYVGASVGLILGHLRLPLLIRYFGSGTLGTAANGLISGAGAFAGAVRHVRDGRVSGHCLLLMGVPSVFGAVVTAYLFTRHVSPFWAYVVIGVMLVLIGATMAAAGKAPEKAGGRRPNIPLEVFIGLVLGGLTAVTGLMLGSLRLPMMIRVLGIDPKVAVGTNMVIGCVTALVASAMTLWRSRTPWGDLGLVLLAVVPPTVIGGWLGGWLTARISKNALQHLAGWIIGLTGVQMIASGFWDAGHDGTPDWPPFTEGGPGHEPDEDDD